MIIRSNFKDYYDCIARKPEFVDKAFIYSRETKHFCKDEDPKVEPFHHWQKVKRQCNKSISFNGGFPFVGYKSSGPAWREEHLACLIVAGKFYPFVWSYWTECSFGVYGGSQKDFNYEDSAIEKLVTKTSFSPKDALKVMAQIKKLRESDFSPLCLKYNAPVMGVSLTHNDSVLTLNPCLNEFKFQRMMDTFQAYQQIFQFVSNVLVPKPKEPKPITAKQKAAAHGFDPKMSFRKDTPPTRKMKH